MRTRRRISPIVMTIVLFVTVVLVSFQRKPSFPAGVWYLNSIHKAGAGKVLDVPGRMSVFLEVSDSSFAGSSECNSFSGQSRVKGDSITFISVVGSKTYCSGIKNDIESILFLGSMPGRAGFRTVRDSLILASEKGYAFHFSRSSGNKDQ